MADYNNITLDIDEEGIWLIDNTDQGDMQMGHVSWRQIAIHVQKELEKLKGDDTDAQVNFALKEAQERTKGMLTEGCCHHQACHARGYCMADRIEELEAENKKLRLEVYHANDVADVSIDKAKELEAKLDLSEGALDIASRSWGECQPIIKELEAENAELKAKLAKAVEALGSLIQQTHNCEKELTEELHHQDFCGESLPLTNARATLAELTGGKDE